VRCQEGASLELTESGRKAIQVTLFEAFEEGIPEDPDLGPIEFLRPPPGSISLLGALESLAEAAQKRPESPAAWLRLGVLQLALLLNRPAEESLGKCLDLVPGQPEATMNLASLLYDKGRGEEAFLLLRACKESEPRWKFLSSTAQEKREVGQSLLDFYNGLREELRRIESPVWIPLAPAKVVRVGRNDPCPCGSGKKYKKCCLN
jgi:tetratricopeptide (TPR) repeat protein